MARALTHVMATFLVVIYIVGLATTASASYLTVYKGPGCKNPAEKYSKCGCNNIKYYGGYKYYYHGKPAIFYKNEYCHGRGYPYDHDQEYCRKYHDWKSIYIKC